MRVMVTTVLSVQIAVSCLVAALFWTGAPGPAASFVVYLVWTTGIFAQASLTLGNLNALAMEPMGHLAGLTASVAGAVGTVIAVSLAVPIGLLFDGTPRPLVTGTLALALLARLLMRSLNRQGA